jgi:hypothetical protein
MDIDPFDNVCTQLMANAVHYIWTQKFIPMVICRFRLVVCNLFLSIQCNVYRLAILVLFWEKVWMIR